MLHHIVMFKFRDDVSEDARRAAREAFKKGIEALPAVIPTIRSVYVGFNANPAERWDICLTSTFDNLEDAKAYGAHPAHRAVASELMKLVGERACTDFE
jgi:hypothetical protein